MDGAFPGGGAGGKGGTTGIELGAAGGNGQVIVCVIEVLPIELVNFKAIPKGDQILLEWQTVTETNNEGFEIQKSLDGTNWSIVKFVPGSGTSSRLNTYGYIDNQPDLGRSYY